MLYIVLTKKTYFGLKMILGKRLCLGSNLLNKKGKTGISNDEKNHTNSESSPACF